MTDKFLMNLFPLIIFVSVAFTKLSRDILFILLPVIVSPLVSRLSKVLSSLMTRAEFLDDIKASERINDLKQVLNAN